MPSGAFVFVPDASASWALFRFFFFSGVPSSAARRRFLSSFFFFLSR